MFGTGVGIGNSKTLCVGKNEDAHSHSIFHVFDYASTWHTLFLKIQFLHSVTIRNRYWLPSAFGCIISRKLLFICRQRVSLFQRRNCRGMKPISIYSLSITHLSWSRDHYQMKSIYRIYQINEVNWKKLALGHTSSRLWERKWRFTVQEMSESQKNFGRVYSWFFPYY